MSENYVVFIEQPIKMDLLKIVTGKLRGKSISDSFLWDPTLNTIFHLIHKQTGTVGLPTRTNPILHSVLFTYFSSFCFSSTPPLLLLR